MSGRLAGKVAVVRAAPAGSASRPRSASPPRAHGFSSPGGETPRSRRPWSRVGHGAFGAQGDVANLADLDRLYGMAKDQAGKLDILFANAGMAEVATVEQIDEAFRTNVKGVLLRAEGVASHAGRIGGNARRSMWTIKGVAGFGLLSATKAAVRSFARTWANEIKGRRSRVNAVSPGPVDTPAVGRASGGYGQAQKLLLELADHVPFGRVGQPDEIAKAVVFLASDDASCVNGAELFVDGGTVQI